MNIVLKLEHIALFALSIFLFALLPYAWWWYLVLLLAPDIGMLGYLVNTRVGAVTYNATHWIAVGVLCYLAGSILAAPLISLAGTIIIGHSALDRVLGYGLKYSDSFKHTHLGML